MKLPASLNPSQIPGKSSPTHLLFSSPSHQFFTNRWFSQSSVILFLNKTDLFRAKLVTSPIYEFYSDYEGPSDYETGVAYMKSKFTPLYRNGSIHPLRVSLFSFRFLRRLTDSLYKQIHCTCACDSEQLKTVFQAVEENILTASLIDAVSSSPFLHA